MKTTKSKINKIIKKGGYKKCYFELIDKIDKRLDIKPRTTFYTELVACGLSVALATNLVSINRKRVLDNMLAETLKKICMALDEIDETNEYTKRFRLIFEGNSYLIGKWFEENLANKNLSSTILMKVGKRSKRLKGHNYKAINMVEILEYDYQLELAEREEFERKLEEYKKGRKA